MPFYHSIFFADIPYRYEVILPETTSTHAHQTALNAPGGIGTYEEFFEILTLKSLHRLDRPIVLYNINGYYDRMKALLQHTADEKFMDVANMELCAFMDGPEQILTYIENYRRQWTQTKE